MGRMFVGYQGERGAYSEAAARTVFDSLTPRPFESFERVVEALNDRAIDQAVIPVHNTLGGPVEPAREALRNGGHEHVATFAFRIEHTLMARPGTSLNDVERIISHPQALSQCEDSLSKLDAAVEEAYDTAGSARRIREQDRPRTAAIASERAASIYDLSILRRGLEDSDRNYTRFRVLTTAQ